MNNIIFYNQKVITVRKEVDEENYMEINNKSWIKAANNLTPNAFKVYLLFASNDNDYTFGLTYAEVNAVIPMSRRGYEKVIKELKEKGYLTHAYEQYWNFNTM